MVIKEQGYGHDGMPLIFSLRDDIIQSTFVARVYITDPTRSFCG